MHPEESGIGNEFPLFSFMRPVTSGCGLWRTHGPGVPDSCGSPYFVWTISTRNTMKLVKRILLVLLLLVLAAVVIGFLMPGSRKIERTVAMGAPPAAIFEQINELKNWPNWSPWYKLDPEAKIVYSEPSSGLNAWYTWDSNNKNVGKGKMTIVEIQENAYIKTKLEFDGMNEAYGYFRLEPGAEGTRVTWGLDAQFGNNPLFRLMGPTRCSARPSPRACRASRPPPKPTR